MHSPLNLPALLFKALEVENFNLNSETGFQMIFHFSFLHKREVVEYLVNGLGDGGLHEIDVANNLGSKSVPQVLVELSVLQIV